MSHATQGRVGHQVESLRRQFLQGPGLPFGDALNAQQVERALEEENVQSCDCVYTALVTLRMLLSQVMDADPSLSGGHRGHSITGMGQAWGHSSFVDHEQKAKLQKWKRQREKTEMRGTVDILKEFDR